MKPDMLAAVAELGSGPLREEAVTRHLRPLFGRALASSRVYLANHTLGRPLDQMQADLLEGAALWSDALRDAWTPWLAEEASYRAALAALLGLPVAECVVPKASAGQALRSVLNTLPFGATVLTTGGEFDSVTAVLRRYAEEDRLRVEYALPAEGRWTAASVGEALAGLPGTRLVVVSQVFYGDGQVFADLPALACAVHAHGAELLVDSYHALGVLAVDMPQLGCDYLIGGCYKYLRGGPGAAFLALAPGALARGVRPLDTGWFAGDAGGDAWLEGTPPVLTYYQARSGLAFTRAVGVERLRRYSLGQLAGLRALLEERGIPSAGGDEEHGAFLTIPSPEAERLVAQLAERDIVVDARAGNLRVCPDCLSTGAELEQFVGALSACWAGMAAR